jgi:hypothetical protein
MKHSNNHSPEILAAIKIIDRDIKFTIMPLLLRKTLDDQGKAIDWTREEQAAQSVAYYQLAERMPRQTVGDSSLNTLDFSQYMRDRGLNPIDFVLTNLRVISPTVGVTAKFIPTLPIERFNGVPPKEGLVLKRVSAHTTIRSTPSMTPEEEASRRIDYARVHAQDSALHELLDCPTFEGCEKAGLPLKDPRARLFAMIYGQPQNMGYLSVSPLMKSFREVWFRELQAARTDYQAGVNQQFLKVLSQINTPDLYDEILAPLKEWTMDMAEKLSTISVRHWPLSGFSHAENQGPGEVIGSPIKEVKSYGFEAVSELMFSFDERVALAGFMAKSGHLKSTVTALLPLVEYPAIVIQVLREADFSDEDARKVLKHCLASYVREISSPKKWIAFGTLQPLIEMYRTAFADHGYQDIKGTHALDGLAVHLDVGEGFERMGYLRREEMSLGDEFAVFHNLSPEDDPIQTTTDEVLTRKMALAIKLNQQQTIARAVDQCLMMQPANNRDLTTRAAVLHALESGYQPIELLLDSPQKVQRALAMGVASSAIVDSPKLKHYHEDVLGRDLGL